MSSGNGTQEAEFVVIGGGPGGYCAAFRAAELGLNVTIVDKYPSLGGGWLYAGCVHSKALLHLTDAIRLAKHAQTFGVMFDPPRIDLEQIRNWVQQITDAMADDLETRRKDLGIKRIQGTASFVDSRTLKITNGTTQRLQFQHALIATGSVAKAPRDLFTESPLIVHSEQALRLEDLPETLLMIGERSTAMELANLYSALGTQVTVVSSSDRLLSRADPDLVNLVMSLMNEVLEEVRLNTRVTSLRDTGNQIEATYEGESVPTRSTFDRVIVAVGRKANLTNLEMSNTHVQLDDRGFISVDKQMRTSDPHIFAVGDVIGRPMLWHKAAHQGKVCAEVVAGWGSEYDPRAVPMVLFTDPQLAWCGLTEREIAEHGQNFETRQITWSIAGKAISSCRCQGVTKMIFDPDTRLLLGMGIVGPHAAEMIAEGIMAIEMGAAFDDLAATMHLHFSGKELFFDQPPTS